MERQTREAVDGVWPTHDRQRYAVDARDSRARERNRDHWQPSSEPNGRADLSAIERRLSESRGVYDAGAWRMGQCGAEFDHRSWTVFAECITVAKFSTHG